MKKIVFLFLFFFYFLPLSINVYATEWNICAENGAGTSCSHLGIAGIQEAIEEAKNGDVININGGKYKSESPIVVDPEYRDQNCLVHTRGKNLTIKGVGNPMIDNNNGNLNNREKWSTGICILGGKVTIDSITIRQTLLPAIFIDEAQVIIKNVTFVDIDHLAINIRRSQVYVINNLIAGSPGVSVGDYSYLRFENNTVYGGAIDFNLCENHEPTGDVLNNILIRSSITAKCSDQTNKLKEIKIKNNFVYHGSSTGDMNCAGPGNTENDQCTDKEICEGVTFSWPDIVGADENGTICVWGEGFIQGDFATKPNSVAGLAGAGYSKGPCVNSASPACQSHIAKYPFPEQKNIDDLIKDPGNKDKKTGSDKSAFKGPVVLENIVLPQFLSTVDLIKFPKIGFTSDKNVKNDVFMNLFLFVIFSVVFIMLFHFAINISDFNIFLTLVYFVIGGVIGLWFNSWMMGLAISIVLSLLFI